MQFKDIEVSGIRRIVINRLIVWDLDSGCCGERVWRKIAGGPGFDPDEAAGLRRATKNDSEMRVIIDRLLSKQITTGHRQGIEAVNEQYRAWLHGDTLNIIQITRGAR